MSCYTRHLSEIFARVGIEHNRQNARQADLHIRLILTKEEADCPAVWQEVKSWLEAPEKCDDLVQRLKEVMISQ